MKKTTNLRLWKSNFNVYGLTEIFAKLVDFLQIS